MSSVTVAFNVVQATGLASALIIIVTAVLTPSVPRLSTWYLVLCSSAGYSLSMLLLAMAHGQSGTEPNPTLCLIQGALIYAGPIWLMSSVCIFAFQIYLTTVFYVKHYSGPIHHNSKWLPASPVILFFLILVSMLTAGILRPEIVGRDSTLFFCHFTNGTGTYAVTVLSVICAIVALVSEWKTGKLLYRHRKHRDEYYRQSHGTVSIGVMCRLAGFSLISILSVTSCGLLLLQPGDSKYDGYLLVWTGIVSNADVPLLGLNRSIIRTWMFWTKQDDLAIQETDVKKGTV
ncbi:hypothetical protein BDP27DRAFT_1339813 [Rhodocollybia butyracea]|uniref:Uncharacterized protein n=1 Tax=Rhodocollybia butyracea TaxID=206335 RepID=A0A9P5PCR1_9AGAR|nr:hypothetical protein BDP27DRAFT_1339813 [Rhodocollybia butyracea]